MALEHASDALRNDRQLVLEAVRQNGLALEYASDALRNDREVVDGAVRQNGTALAYAGEALYYLSYTCCGDARRKDHLAISFRNREACYARSGHPMWRYRDLARSARRIIVAGRQDLQLQSDGRAWRIRRSRCN